MIKMEVSMKRAVLFFLAMLLVFSFSSCGSEESAPDPPNDVPVSAAPETTAETADPTLDENGFQKDALPEELSLGGATVTFYVRGDTLESEFINDNTGEVLQDALYYRDLNIEERLDVNLEYFANTSADFWGERILFMDTVRSAVMSADGTMDIVAGLSIMMPIMAREGLFYNLLGSKIQYMDFEKPWWPANMIEEMAIQDKLYFASGEASLGVIKGAICMFFNNDLISEYNLENPYDLVFNGEWTIDKWNEMASGVYTDSNGNGIEDNDDIVGFFIQNENHAPNFFSAADILLAERNEDGFPELKCKTERFVNFMERIVSYMKQPGFTSDRDDEDVFSNMFNTGHALFATGEFGNLETMRENEFVFGTIPFPKYDSSQENYGSSTRSTFSGLAIPKCGNAEYADIILEAFSSESYRTVSPAYYEIAMKDKYSRDSVSAQMYDMIDRRGSRKHRRSGRRDCLWKSC